MIPARLLPSLLFCGGALLAAEPGVVVPQAFPEIRYADLAQKSMFAPPAPAAPVQSRASFAADLFVVGLAQFENKDFVMIINRQTHEKFSLVTGGGKGPGDVELGSVRWESDPARSVVTVKRGVESSVLQFDESAFQKPLVQAPVQTTGPRAGMPFRPPLPIPVRHTFPLNH